MVLSSILLEMHFTGRIFQTTKIQRRARAQRCTPKDGILHTNSLKIVFLPNCQNFKVNLIISRVCLFFNVIWWSNRSSTVYTAIHRHRKADSTQKANRLRMCAVTYSVSSNSMLMIHNTVLRWRQYTWHKLHQPNVTLL